MALEFYTEWIPDGILEPYVARIWSWNGPVPDTNAMRFLPPGTAQLFFSFSGLPFYSRKAGEQTWEMLAPWVFIGPQFSYFDMTTAPMKRMAGVIFKPGGTLPFFETEPKDLVDVLTPLEDISGGRRQSPFPLKDLTEPKDAIPVLADSLERLLRAPVRHGTVLDQLDRWDGTLFRVDSLSRRFGLSTKRLARIFEASFGVQPKRFARVRRFNGALREIFEGKNQVLVDVAAQMGCFDQAHLNREFRLFSGISPAQYVRSAKTLYYFPLIEGREGSINGRV